MQELDLSKREGIGSLNLTKGVSLNLTKNNNELKNIQIGLGWQTRMDLDTIAVLMSGDTVYDRVYFGDMCSQGIYLNGDDLTGGGIGDNEIIFASLNQIPKTVDKICLFANIYNPQYRQTFGDVRNSYIRLVNSDTNEELCRYSLEDEFANNTAVHFANMIRDENNDWKFITIGKGLNGSYRAIVNYCNNGFIEGKNIASINANRTTSERDTRKKGFLEKLFDMFS